MNRKTLAIVMAAMLASTSAQAEEAGSDYLGQEVVVSATKSKNKRQDVSNSVIVIDQKSIEDSTAQSVGELLANRAGIDLATTGDYGGAAQEIQIRGMDAGGTQVYINGVNINSISLGSADVSRIPLATIEKIEIVKGASSMLYGSGASGGVINIITREPSADKPLLSATLQGGTEGTYGMSLTQGMPLGSGFGYVLNLGKHGTDGYRDNSVLHEADASIDIKYQQNEKFRVSLYGNYTHRDFGLPSGDPPSGTPIVYANGIQYSSDDAASLLNHHRDDEALVALTVEGRPSGIFRYTIKPSYTYSRSYNYQRGQYSSQNSQSWIINEVAGVEGFAGVKPVEGLDVLLGAEYKDYRNKNRQMPMTLLGEDITASEAVYKHGYNTKAIYSDVQYRPASLVKFIGGVRQEDNSVFGVETVYRYGLVLNPASRTAIKFNRGSHFKAPTMNDLFWPDTGYAKGNPDLSPETGWHTEVTLEQGIGEKVFLSASYFNWNIKDKIDWAEDFTQPSGGGYYYWVPTNLNKYKSDGFELSATLEAFRGLSISADYTIMYAVEEQAGNEPRRAAFTPKHQFKASVTYKNGGLTLAPVATYVGNRPYYGSNTTDDPAITLSSYWVFDMKVAQKLDDHFTLALNACNIFDRDYATRLDPSRYPYPGTGRSFLFEVNYNY